MERSSGLLGNSDQLSKRDVLTETGVRSTAPLERLGVVGRQPPTDRSCAARGGSPSLAEPFSAVPGRGWATGDHSPSDLVLRREGSPRTFFAPPDLAQALAANPAAAATFEQPDAANRYSIVYRSTSSSDRRLGQTSGPGTSSCSPAENPSIAASRSRTPGGL